MKKPAVSKKSGSNKIAPISLKKANNLVSKFIYKPIKGAKRGK